MTRQREAPTRALFEHSASRMYCPTIMLGITVLSIIPTLSWVFERKGRMAWYLSAFEVSAVPLLCCGIVAHLALSCFLPHSDVFPRSTNSRQARRCSLQAPKNWRYRAFDTSTRGYFQGLGTECCESQSNRHSSSLPG